MKKIHLYLIFFLILSLVSCGQDSKTTDKVMESANFIVGSESPIINVKPGLRRQILGYNDGIMLVKVYFDEEMVGQRPPMHSHPHTQSSYIVSGRFEMHCGDEVKVLGAGDAYYIAPNVPHEAYCLESGVIIDGFSPVREDFLK